MCRKAIMFIRGTAEMITNWEIPSFVRVILKNSGKNMMETVPVKYVYAVIQPLLARLMISEIVLLGQHSVTL